jgi:hypothetical protein
LFTIDFDHPIVAAKLYATIDENAIAFTNVLTDRLSATIPGFTAKPSNFLNFLTRFIFVAFIYCHIEVSNRRFSAGITGRWIITETTENSDLIESSAHSESPSVVKKRIPKVPMASGR